jgi:hypothetical protein
MKNPKMMEVFMDP